MGLESLNLPLQLTLADAILDRLVHNTHRLTLSGESMRKRRNGLTNKEESE
ncbi:MAG: IstB-like ATP-binding protein [uncultured Caballeronia sp.]|nr:MAG: IstB-like ATP-binding protein [uncultured Caballeronia sp.]